MKTLPLLVSTLLLVLCHSATVTVGGPTGKSQFKGDDLTKSFDDLNRPFKAAEACFEEAEEYFQTQGSITSTSSNQVLGRKCERLENDSNSDVCDDKEVDEFFQIPGWITPTFVKFLDLETSKTHCFISIPDLEGNDHVYVVQVTPKLGKGGNGHVYLAKDIKIPGEFVAIKVTMLVHELNSLKLVGELLGSTEKAGQLYLVMPFAPGITLHTLAYETYNEKPVYEYWKDENNKGYRTLLKRIARDVVAPLVNIYFNHWDLKADNIMVAQIDENYVPTETDPATGLQHLRAVDFGGSLGIQENENILDQLDRSLRRILLILPDAPEFETTIETFQRDVLDALDDNKFDITRRTEDGMPINVSRRRKSLPSS